MTATATTPYRGRVVGRDPLGIAPTFPGRRAPDVASALHEAGHVLVARALGFRVDGARIGRVGQRDGTVHSGEVRWSGPGRLNGRPRAVLAVAGRVAEALTGSTAAVDGGDLDVLEDVADALNVRDARAWTEGVIEEAAEILRPRLAELDLIATALLVRGDLTGAHVERVLATGDPYCTPVY